MIRVNVLASGSKGNCTAVTTNAEIILLDVGVNFGTLQRALNFKNPISVFLTHEHSDHVNKSTLAELLKRGVEVYMTEGTAQALKLKPRHNLKIFEPLGVGYFEQDILNDEITVYADKVAHDAAEPVGFWVEAPVDAYGNRSGVVAYVTDTDEVPYEILPQIMIIEANHDTETLLAADIDAHQKQRILHNHLSIEKVAKYFKNADKEFLQEVHLIHISKRHGNAEKFRQIVQEIVGDNVKVFAY